MNRSRELFAVGVLWFVALLALTAVLSACGRTVTAPDCFADTKADTTQIRDTAFVISVCAR